jgi:hypothetical protein
LFETSTHIYNLQIKFTTKEMHEKGSGPEADDDTGLFL